MQARDTRFGSVAESVAVLEGITDAIAVFDARWRFVYLNPAAEALLRQPRAALLGEYVWAVLPKLGGDVFEAGCRRVLVTGLATTFEVFSEPLNSWFEVSASHSAAGLAVCCRDITVRRGYEAGLRAGTRRDQMLMDHATDGLLIADIPGNIIEVNARLCAMMGHPREWLLGRSFADFFDPDDIAARPLRRAELLAGEILFNVRRLRRPDGAIVPLETRSRLLDDGRVQIIFRDITERKEAAEQAASEAILAEAQRIAHLGSWAYDYATETFSYSDEVYRIGGYVPGEVTLTPAFLIAGVHPEDRARVRAGLQSGLDGQGLDDLDYRIVRPGGEIRFVQTHAEVLRDADGRPIRFVGTIQDVTEHRALEARLLHQAFHDPLTGLPNRALFYDRLSHALARAGREGQICAVLFLDLDRFKHINDAFGHATGDQFLITVAARLGTVVRESDTLARLGGDEFAVLLEDVGDLTEALRVAERLHLALAVPITVEGRELVAGTSVGVALQSAPDDRPDELLRFADVALYRAKEAGRACTEVFYPGMSARALERLELERDLRGAIEGDELVLYYQPKVDLATGRVAGLEALVRWWHPVRGLVQPGDFIPLAEETGLIVPLGRWVLREACRQLRAWQEAYPHIVAPVAAVNLSPRQFRHPDLAGDVAAALAETGLDPALLCLEITETVAMDSPEAAIAALRALKALGVSLALDDFGTGYSSLAYLQRLPVDALKVDRSFFAGGERNRAIIKAVADLGHGLGLEVIAEGLETAEQVIWARGAGFDRGQGYHFARPLSAEEIEGMWAAGLRFQLPTCLNTARLVAAT